MFRGGGGGGDEKSAKGDAVDESTPPSTRSFTTSASIEIDNANSGTTTISDDNNNNNNNNETEKSNEVEYKHMAYHWFYTSQLADQKTVWLPMSHKDSHNLEAYYTHHALVLFLFPPSTIIVLLF